MLGRTRYHSGISKDPARQTLSSQRVYITEGEGIFNSVHCKNIKVSAGQLLFLFPGEWHSYEPLSRTGWEEYWMGINGANIDNLCDNHFFSKQMPVIDIGFNEEIVGLYKQAIGIATYQKTAFQQMLAGIAQLLLSSVFYANKNNAFRDKHIIALIDRGRMMMRDNANNNKSPDTIARELNISYSWFRRVFKQYTGFSPAQYQMEIKIRKAKELLTSTQKPVKEIAYDLNFESFPYFVTFFKSKVGISPTSYRKGGTRKKNG